MATQPKGNDEFEFARRQLRSQANAESSRRQQALKRQFARLGGLGSGAFVKVSQQAESDIGKKEQAALQGIQAAERAEGRRIREIKEGREFASGEALKQREFAGGEALKQREFAGGEAGKQRQFISSERGATQEFGAGQAKLAREFARGERKDTQAFSEQELTRRIRASDEQGRLNRALQNELSAQKIDLAREQFAEEKRVNDFNIQMARKEAGRPTDLFGSLFGSQFSTESGGGLGFVGDAVGGLGGLVGGLF